MDVRGLLPIGSIVLLKNGKKRLMICGIKQTEVKDSGVGKEYDYMGVLYPEGHVGERFQYLFNHQDIETVVFRGYEDEERTIFLNRLAEVVAGGGAMRAPEPYNTIK